MDVSTSDVYNMSNSQLASDFLRPLKIKLSQQTGNRTIPIAIANDNVTNKQKQIMIVGVRLYQLHKKVLLFKMTYFTLARN